MTEGRDAALHSPMTRGSRPSSNYVPDCVVCDGRGLDSGYVMRCVVCSGTGKWAPGALCPCHCGVRALKLTKRGHVVGCSCRGCLGARNRRKGQKAQRNAHKALGGTGNTPSNEEWAAGYDLEIRVQPETKKGAQIPKSLLKGLETEWFRRALRQAEMANAPGKHPAVYIEPEGSTSGWMIVKMREGR